MYSLETALCSETLSIFARWILRSYISTVLTHIMISTVNIAVFPFLMILLHQHKKLDKLGTKKWAEILKGITESAKGLIY